MEGDSVSVLWWEEVLCAGALFWGGKMREGRQGRKSKGKRLDPPGPRRTPGPEKPRKTYVKSKISRQQPHAFPEDQEG